MTEEPINTEPLVESELDALKARADQMGIKYHPSIGVDALKAKITEKMGELDTDPLAGDDEDPVADPEPKLAIVPTKPTVLTQAQKNVRLKKECAALVRVRIACMNPNKREWEGEIFTTGNQIVGTFKKYVPYDETFHIPQIILTMIEQRKCQVFHTVTDKRTGNKRRVGKLVPEFAIEKLPSLTAVELKDLAQRQAMANGTADAA
jgi:hypothetical protein